eukprot:GHVU01031692.1.p2 GENE.GHVU01031692.1~~GHVU01031692.1.p2  ORF type:complete len:263 (-),score=28.00 GHVU01031692.1:393-1181(-)
MKSQAGQAAQTTKAATPPKIVPTLPARKAIPTFKNSPPPSEEWLDLFAEEQCSPSRGKGGLHSRSVSRPQEAGGGVAPTSTPPPIVLGSSAVDALSPAGVSEREEDTAEGDEVSLGASVTPMRMKASERDNMWVRANNTPSLLPDTSPVSRRNTPTAKHSKLPVITRATIHCLSNRVANTDTKPKLATTAAFDQASIFIGPCPYPRPLECDERYAVTNIWSATTPAVSYSLQPAVDVYTYEESRPKENPHEASQAASPSGNN